MRLPGQDGGDLVGRAGVAGGQVEIAPRDAAGGARRRVPGMVRVGKAHPHEPVLAVGEPVEEGDRAVGDPVGVVMLLRDRVVLRLGCAGVAPAFGVQAPAPEEREVPLPLSGVMRVEPFAVMVATEGAVHGELHTLEAAPRPRRALAAHRVLAPAERRVEGRLEVGLAEEGGAVAGALVEVGGHARRVDRERHAVGVHAMGAHVLAGDHRRARRHADHVLVVRAAVVEARGRQPVDDRGARDPPAVAAERVVALLVGGDEEDLAAHAFTVSGR